MRLENDFEKLILTKCDSKLSWIIVSNYNSTSKTEWKYSINSKQNKICIDNEMSVF